MGIFDFLKGNKDGSEDSGGGEEKTFTCAKCGKEKKESEGRHVLEGSAFCCDKCCGDPEKGEHKEKSDKTCEFC